ncbi:MAG TPA: hypothetical protein VI958_07110 [Acidobacteriota bacterium]
MVAILVVLTILTCIMVDALMEWSRARRSRLGLASAVRTDSFRAFTPESIALPSGLFLAPGHTWVEVNPNGRAHVGLDDFLPKAIGRIDEIVLPAIGKEVHQGEALFTVRQGDRKIEVPAPIDGVVNSINENLSVAPELTQVAPYKQGWVCDVTPKNLAKNVKQLCIAEEALAWVRNEVRRFQDFLSVRPLENFAVGHVLQDGGIPTCGVLEFLDDETWNHFASEFVRVPSH